MSALNALLAGAVDYAGLFPPASLGMRAAVRAYGACRRGPHARLLGAFVVPAMRLEELASELDALDAGATEPPWPLSVISGELVDGDVTRALRFEHAGARGPSARVASIEVRAGSATAVMRLAALVPRAMTLVIEIPLSLGRDERRAVLSAVKTAGRAAKLRTGGVTADVIPPARLVAEFAWDCARIGVPFKATAGLHHPLRSERPLTYDAGSPRAVMHGFVNVLLTAVIAWRMAQSDQSAAPPQVLAELLDERDASAFDIGDTAIRWRGLEIQAADITRARHDLVRTFGSCSLDEPVANLEALGWLTRA